MQLNQKEEKERSSGIPSEYSDWPKGAHLVEVNVSYLVVARFGSYTQDK